MDDVGLNIRFARTDDSRLAALAPPHWRRKAAEKRFQRDREQELVAGGLLADMIADLHPGLDDLAIEEDPSGKPRLRSHPGIHFSLSHTEGLAMCVVADHPVGCDVEKVVPLDDDLKRAIGSLEAWTLKEAAFKCGPSAVPRPHPAPSGYCAALAEIMV